MNEPNEKRDTYIFLVGDDVPVWLYIAFYAGSAAGIGACRIVDVRPSGQRIDVVGFDAAAVRFVSERSLEPACRAGTG